MLVMKLETLLPLGKVDPGLRTPDTPLDIHSVAADAQFLESIGYDGLVVEETKDDPFVIIALAAQATTTLKLGTAVTIAFPRSPTVMALSAWTLQKSDTPREAGGLMSGVASKAITRVCDYGQPSRAVQNEPVPSGSSSSWARM